MRNLGADGHRRTPGNGSGEPSYVEKALGLTLLLVLAVGCGVVLLPFLKSILLAVVLCVSTWPLYRRAEMALGGRRTLAALLITLTFTVLLLVPLVLLGTNLADDAARLATAVGSAIERGLPPPSWLVHLPVVGAEAERAWLQVSQQGQGIGPTLAPYLRPMRNWALEQGATLLSGTVQVALSIIFAFFLYRDGAYMERRLEAAMSRLAGWRARHLFQTAGLTIKSVVNGVLGTSVIQGILVGLSFWIAGVPGPAIIGAFAVVLSLVPAGLALLWLPAGLWLLSAGETESAIFLMAWNGLLVGNLDNVLRPILIRRGIALPATLIFLGVLGGLITFGIVGVFLGPVLLAVGLTLFQDWGRAKRPSNSRKQHLAERVDHTG